MPKSVVSTVVSEVSTQLANILSVVKELEDKQMEIRLKFDNLSLNGDIALSFIPVRKGK